MQTITITASAVSIVRHASTALTLSLDASLAVAKLHLRVTFDANNVLLSEFEFPDSLGEWKKSVSVDLNSLGALSTVELQFDAPCYELYTALPAGVITTMRFASVSDNYSIGQTYVYIGSGTSREAYLSELIIPKLGSNEGRNNELIQLNSVAGNFLINW